MTTTIKPCDSYDYTMLDGYAWAEQQAKSIHGPLHADASMGDWPYNIVLRGARDDKYIIKEFTEHDVKTWVYTDKNEYTKHLASLREYWAEQCDEGSIDGYGGITA
jgi:hypothetical protein